VLRGNPNALGDREAMDLPDRFVGRMASDLLARHATELLGRPPRVLAAIAGDPGSPAERRYLAGTVLALVGDPRIQPDDPPMVDVPTARVRIGLAPGQVAAVTGRWRHAGVQQNWIRKECPAHETDIAAFRLMRYPVTNLEYRRFLEDTGAAWLPSSWRFGAYPDLLANCPVWSVSPEAADAYAAWLSARTGRSFRLPTESEWEYAASGGDGREFPWGERFRADAANTVEAGPLTATPIGIYPAGRSPFGADDMGGNVEELVADEYRAYPGGAIVEDDLLRASGSYRVTRGGCFTRFGDLARCRRRHGWFGRPLYAIGFRMAETERR
jgi:formylglycine-generating enzyme required for sulfatase activity